MRLRFLGEVPFDRALATQSLAFEDISRGRSDGLLLGFESQATVTLGLRGKESDLLISAQSLAEKGVALHRIDRGGQATLHNPGQLVIFPVVRLGECGSKEWVDLLMETTKQTLSHLGTVAEWNPQLPGLYTERGKVCSIGVRVRRGISTHGIAINVHNDLEVFQCIRVCGREGASVDRVKTDLSTREIFVLWAEKFMRAHQVHVPGLLTS